MPIAEANEQELIQVLQNSRMGQIRYNAVMVSLSCHMSSVRYTTYNLVYKLLCIYHLQFMIYIYLHYYTTYLLHTTLVSLQVHLIYNFVIGILI